MKKLHSHAAIDCACESPERTRTRTRAVSFGKNLQPRIISDERCEWLGAEGRPFYTSARPKDVASLNVVRQQNSQSRFTTFRRLKMQTKQNR